MFTKEDPLFIPKLFGPNYPTIDPLIINQNGVKKLLSGLNPSKAAGPDQIPCRILKELSVELAPIFTALFRQSLNTGTLSSLWSQAFVSPIYEKGHGVCWKTTAPFPWLVHRASILCKHIRNHLDQHGILILLNHRFRTKHSCETHLLLTLQDLMNYRDKKDQIGLAVLDFSKAFDAVPHDDMLGNWIFTASLAEADQVLLQQDLSALELWGDTWGMCFNATKCNIMHISCYHNTLTRIYSLCNHVLSEVDAAKYLGINLSSELSWSPHVSCVVSKANSTLDFLRRNLTYPLCNQPWNMLWQAGTLTTYATLTH